MASFSEPDRIHEVLTGAGFTDIDVNPVTLRTCWGRDAPDAVDFYLSRTPGLTVPGATREEMAACCGRTGPSGASCWAPGCGSSPGPSPRSAREARPWQRGGPKRAQEASAGMISEPYVSIVASFASCMS